MDGLEVDGAFGADRDGRLACTGLHHRYTLDVVQCSFKEDLTRSAVHATNGDDVFHTMMGGGLFTRDLAHADYFLDELPLLGWATCSDCS